MSEADENEALRISVADEALAKIGKLDLDNDVGWSAARQVILDLMPPTAPAPATNAVDDLFARISTAAGDIAKLCSNSWHRERAARSQKTVTTQWEECPTCGTSVKFRSVT